MGGGEELSTKECRGLYESALHGQGFKTSGLFLWFLLSVSPTYTRS